MSGNTIGPGGFQPLQHAQLAARAAAQADAATVDAHEASQALDDNAGTLQDMKDGADEKGTRLRDRKAMRQPDAAGLEATPEDGLDPSILARLRAEADASSVDQHELQEGMDHANVADEWLDDEEEKADRVGDGGQPTVRRADTVYRLGPEEELRLEELDRADGAPLASVLDDIPEERRAAAHNYLAAQIGETGPAENLTRLVPVEGPAALEAAAEPMLAGPLDVHDEGTRRPLPPPDFGPEVHEMARAAGLDPVFTSP